MLDIVIYFVNRTPHFNVVQMSMSMELSEGFTKRKQTFSEISNLEIADVQNKINNMPRKIFAWKSNLEIKHELNF